MKQIIKPLVSNCVKCKAKVTSHHKMCDNCWGKRAKKDFRLKCNKMVIEEIIKHKQKQGRIIPQRLLTKLKEIKDEIKKNGKK